MIPLDSPVWKTLDHAYGSAEDLPALLSDLEAGDFSAFDEIEGCICHQGSIYPASILAVPHLLRIARACPVPAIKVSMLILLGRIRASVDYRGEKVVLPDATDSFETAFPAALALAIEALPAVDDETDAIYLLESAAALRGSRVLGNILHGFADKEFSPECPSCERQLYIWPDGPALSTAAEDPVSRPGTKRVSIEAADPEAEQTGWLSWLLTQSRGPILASVRGLLPFIFGRARCPGCGTTFSIVDAYERDFGEEA